MISHTNVRDLSHRGFSLPTRNNMRALASQFPLACLSWRQWVEELFAFLKRRLWGGAPHPPGRACPADSLAVLFPGLLPVSIPDYVAHFSGNRILRWRS